MRHPHRTMLPVTLCLALAASAASGAGEAFGPGEIKYVSSADATDQPAIFYAPESKRPVPLLVALHTWSGDYKQRSYNECVRWCAEKRWAYIHPNFRGRNRTPQATGSDLVVADIVSAVEFAKRNTAIDAGRIYAMGVSGGGYTALLLAGRKPEIWAGVSAWASITNLRIWYFECRRARRQYYKEIGKSCGGAPGASPAVDREYKHRSPVTHLKNAVGLPVDINAGIHDGHKGSVPINHSLRAFNVLAAEADRISDKDIAFLLRWARVPPRLQRSVTDPSYGQKVPLFRKSSGKARVTLFDGGHELVAEAALTWLQRQKKATKPGEALCPSPGNVRKGIHLLDPADQERVTQRKPGDWDAAVLAADHHFLACDGDRAGKGYAEVLKHDPKHIRANLGMGEWHVAHQRLEKAMPYLRKVLGLADKKSAEYGQAKAVLEYATHKTGK